MMMLIRCYHFVVLALYDLSMMYYAGLPKHFKGSLSVQFDMLLQPVLFIYTLVHEELLKHLLLVSFREI